MDESVFYGDSKVRPELALAGSVRDRRRLPLM